MFLHRHSVEVQIGTQGSQPAASRFDQPKQLVLHQLNSTGSVGMPTILQSYEGFVIATKAFW